MRILHVIPTLTKGGAERLVLDIGKALIKKQNTSFKIITFNDTNQYPELSTGLDIEVCPSQVTYSITGKSVIKVASFKKAIKAFQPDIIHTHLLEADFVTQYAYYKGAKYVTHWHGCYNATNPQPFSKWFSKEYIGNKYAIKQLKKEYISNKTHFVAISGFIYQYLRKNVGIRSNKITTIPNAINLERFQYHNERKFDGTIKLINIGSMMPNKNQTFLLQLVKKIKDSGLKVSLTLVGDGPTLTALKAQAKELQIEKDVNFTGIISNPEKHLNDAHIYVHSAWHEPFGLVLIEAMSCGLPIVSFNTGGPKEIIKHKKSGFLVLRDDLGTFIHMVLELNENKELYQRFSENAILSSKQYDMKNYADKLLTLYQSLLS